MKFVSIVLLSLLTSPVWGQMNWESRASLPNQGVTYSISFNVGGKYYVGLGHTYGGVYSKEMWEYDPATNIWTKKKNYPGSGSRHAIAMVVGSRVFVGLGASATARYNDFYEYNPSSDTWTQRASFSGGAQYASGSFVIGDSGYVVLGSCGGPTCYNDELWMYVPSTNSWKQMANFPGGDGVSPVAFSIGRYGYVGNEVSPSKTLTNDFYRYDPSNNSWSKIASLPGTTRKSTSAFSLTGKGYVGFGSYGSPTTSYANDLYMYDTSNNSWTRITVNNDFTEREAVRFEVLSDSLVLGGFGNNFSGELTDFWQLQLDSTGCDYYDTTFIITYDTVSVNDTSFVTLYDTTNVYDTIMVYDTVAVYDSVTVYDTTSIIVYDTMNVIVYDTSYITVYDTVQVYRIDTITVNDTLWTTVYDTVFVIDTVTYTRYIDVEDTLNIYLYDSTGCGTNAVSLYPNPTREYLHVYTNILGCYQNGTLEIIDQWGRTVRESKFDQQLITFDIKGLASALYFIRLVDENNTIIFVRKLEIH